MQNTEQTTNQQSSEIQNNQNLETAKASTTFARIKSNPKLLLLFLSLFLLIGVLVFAGFRLFQLKEVEKISKGEGTLSGMNPPTNHITSKEQQARILFKREVLNKETNEDGFWITDFSGNQQQVLSFRNLINDVKPGKSYMLVSTEYSISPNKKHLAIVLGWREPFDFSEVQAYSGYSLWDIDLTVWKAQKLSDLKLSNNSFGKTPIDRDGKLTPSWSADSKTVYYTSGEGGKLSIWSVNIDNGNKIELTKNASRDCFYPITSPNGVKVAFICLYDINYANGPYSFGVINTDGSGYKSFDNEVMSNNDYRTQYPDNVPFRLLSWIDNNNLLVKYFNSSNTKLSKEGNVENILAWKLNVETGNFEQMKSPQNLTTQADNFAINSISKNKQWYLYSANKRGGKSYPGSPDIAWVIPREGYEAKEVDVYGWWTDDNRLSFNRDGNIYIFEPMSGEKSRIYDKDKLNLTCPEASYEGAGNNLVFYVRLTVHVGPYGPGKEAEERAEKCKTETKFSGLWFTTQTELKQITKATSGNEEGTYDRFLLESSY